ncbi:MAG: hypothetical protein ABL886_07410 [Rhodoglobus sp.]
MSASPVSLKGRWDSVMDSSGRLQVRSRYFGLVGGGVVCVGTIACVTYSLVAPDGGGPIEAIVVLVLGALLLWRIGRIALAERGESVVIRNFFSSRVVPWESIDAVEVRSRRLSRGPSAAVSFRVGGRHRTSSATVTYSRRTAEEICNAVGARAAAHQVPCDLSAATLTSGF